MTQYVSTTFSSFREIIAISRPHIWIYTLGSFAFGVILGGYYVNTTLVFSWSLLLFSILLTLPVNIFLYALNDYFDIETDLDNPKKTHLERRVDTSEKKQLILFTYISLIMILSTFLLTTYKIMWLILLWLFLVYTYNVPPFRFKAKPFLDMFFSVNFLLWGVVGYVFVTGFYPDLSFLLPVIFFAISMHIYTSIHDIPYDRESEIITSAVYLGSVRTNLYASVFLYIPVIIFLIMNGFIIFAIVSLVYPLFFILQIARLKNINLLVQYKYFIILHHLVGFLLFIYSISIYESYR